MTNWAFFLLPPPRKKPWSIILLLNRRRRRRSRRRKRRRRRSRRRRRWCYNSNNAFDSFLQNPAHLSGLNFFPPESFYHFFGGNIKQRRKKKTKIGFCLFLPPLFFPPPLLRFSRNISGRVFFDEAIKPPLFSPFFFFPYAIERGGERDSKHLKERVEITGGGGDTKRRHLCGLEWMGTFYFCFFCKKIFFERKRTVFIFCVFFWHGGRESWADLIGISLSLSLPFAVCAHVHGTNLSSSPSNIYIHTFFPILSAAAVECKKVSTIVSAHQLLPQNFVERLLWLQSIRWCGAQILEFYCTVLVQYSSCMRWQEDSEKCTLREWLCPD